MPDRAAASEKISTNLPDHSIDSNRSLIRSKMALYFDLDNVAAPQHPP